MYWKVFVRYICMKKKSVETVPIVLSVSSIRSIASVSKTGARYNHSRINLKLFVTVDGQKLALKRSRCELRNKISDADRP